MKYILILFILFFTAHCSSSGSSLINDNKIYVGMSKEDLCSVMLWQSTYDEDACLENTANSKYNSKTKKEIIWGKNGRTYFIIRENSYDNKLYLESWTNSYTEALERIQPKKKIIIPEDIEIIGAGN